MKKARMAHPSNVRTSTDPLAVPRTVRNHDFTILTSLPAGKMVPIAVAPLLREDSARVRLSMGFQMMETADLLINAVNVNVKAYLVPTLAFERFTGMDDLNRAWEGQPARDGMPVTPFIEHMPAKAHGADAIMKYLGKHAKPGSQINTAYHEAYNLIWNFRAKNRSPDITERARLLDTLAPAFWLHSRFAHIVPDFDEAIMDGEVALNIASQNLALKNGAAVAGNIPVSLTGSNLFMTATSTGARSVNLRPGNNIGYSGAAVGGDSGVTAVSGLTASLAGITAELGQNGVTVSLANLELAKKTQAFARLRQQFTGHDDDYIVDMLMDGLSVPEQNWRQPILLTERATIFGMSKRYATNGGDLTESVVNGATMLDLSFACPRIPTGGIIMVVAECTPDQLFERGRDPYLFASTTDDFPHGLRDMLDPQPVEAVRNDYVDIDHDLPAGTFGYAPMNHEWNFASPCIGGRFYRPEVDAGFQEDRVRIWAVETENPKLSEDFYLCKTMHTKPFVNPNQDPFELAAQGAASITGLTQFGPLLVEANGDYEAVMDEAPTDRLPKA